MDAQREKYHWEKQIKQMHATGISWAQTTSEMAVSYEIFLKDRLDTI